VINGLLGSSFELVALTRKAASPAATALASNLNVSVIEGDLSDSPSIFSKLPPIHGVFSVRLPLPNALTEEKQGKTLADAAVAHGVKQFAYTSAERGGPSKLD
jgi:uncharacterized protein YbjT (DUF2867 family)